MASKHRLAETKSYTTAALLSTSAASHRMTKIFATRSIKLAVHPPVPLILTTRPKNLPARLISPALKASSCVEELYRVPRPYRMSLVFTSRTIELPRSIVSIALVSALLIVELGDVPLSHLVSAIRAIAPIVIVCIALHVTSSPRQQNSALENPSVFAFSATVLASSGEIGFTLVASMSSETETRIPFPAMFASTSSRT